MLTATLYSLNPTNKILLYKMHQNYLFLSTQLKTSIKLGHKRSIGMHLANKNFNLFKFLKLISIKIGEASVFMLTYTHFHGTSHR